VAIFPFLLFPQKQEFSKFKEFWTSAEVYLALRCGAGVTIFRLFAISSKKDNADFVCPL
jgi:hypothetical protein